ncbi:MAG: hypothetical protein MZW92_40185 [Comamonadaceae bacterium]|nr:hypothetical protein [Comamonadaceae bacterium]
MGQRRLGGVRRQHTARRNHAGDAAGDERRDPHLRRRSPRPRDRGSGQQRLVRVRQGRERRHLCGRRRR